MPSENARQFATVIIRVKPQRMSSYDYAKDGMIQIGSANDQ
jgi:hypothetical protein